MRTWKNNITKLHDELKNEEIRSAVMYVEQEPLQIHYFMHLFSIYNLDSRYFVNFQNGFHKLDLNYVHLTDTYPFSKVFFTHFPSELISDKDICESVKFNLHNFFERIPEKDIKKSISLLPKNFQNYKTNESTSLLNKVILRIDNINDLNQRDEYFNLIFSSFENINDLFMIIVGITRQSEGRIHKHTFELFIKYISESYSFELTDELKSILNEIEVFKNTKQKPTE